MQTTGAQDAPTSGTAAAAVAGARPGARWPTARWAAVAVGCLVVVVPYWIATVRQPLSTMEESARLLYPDLLAHGQWPNRDFEHVYGPGDLWVLAATYAVTGPSLLALRTLGVLYHLLASVAVAGIGWRVDRRLAIGAAATCWLLLAPVGGPLPAVGAMALILAAVWAAMVACSAPHRTVVVAAAGLAAAAALSFRPDFGVAVVLGCAPLWATPALRRRWRPLTGGAAAGLVPLAVHVAVVGPRSAWQGMVVDPVVRHSPGRRLPFPPSFDEAPDVFTRIADATGAPTYAPWSLPVQVALVVWAAVAACVGLVVVVAVARVRAGRAPRPLLALGGVALGLLPYAVQRADSAHAGLVLAGVGPLVPIAIALVRRSAVAVSSRRPAVVRLASWWGVAAVVAVVPAAPAILAQPAAARYADAIGRPAAVVVEGSSGRSLPLPPRVGDEVQAVVDAVRRHTAPGARIVVAPRDLRRTNYAETYLYHLLPDRRPGTYHLEMNPGTANGPTSRLPGDLGRADLVVLTSRFDGWREANRSHRAGSSEATGVVATRFEVVAQVGPYTLLAQRPGAGSLCGAGCPATPITDRRAPPPPQRRASATPPGGSPLTSSDLDEEDRRAGQRRQVHRQILHRRGGCGRRGYFAGRSQGQGVAARWVRRRRAKVPAACSGIQWLTPSRTTNSKGPVTWSAVASAAARPTERSASLQT